MNIQNKFLSIEKSLSDAKGDFILFGLFEREESLNNFDVVISADWIKKRY